MRIRPFEETPELDEDFDSDGDLRDPFFMKLVDEMNHHYQEAFSANPGQEYEC